MAYIKVDHSKFGSAVSAIDTYVSQMKSKMGNANNEVNLLSSSWQGADFTQFKTEWDKVTNKESTYSEMMKSLEAYSKYLKYAESKYKDAQSKAVNRANNLPRY